MDIQTIKCPKCGTDVPLESHFCPNCGLSRYQPSQQNKKSHGCLITAVVLGSVLLFFAIISAIILPTIYGHPSVSSVNVQAKPSLELLNSKCIVDGFSTHITGIVKNNTDKIYSYVLIEFNLYDKSGNHIGTALANTSNLDAKWKWKFEAIGFYTDTEKYKLSTLSGH